VGARCTWLTAHTVPLPAASHQASRALPQAVQAQRWPVSAWPQAWQRW